MKVEELVGADIMKAYDGKYLAKDFGYSCANFNVKPMWGGGRNWHNFESVNFGDGSENTPDTFDFYTKNTKNVSCFVCYNYENKIWGRRMFFKGKSMTNDDEFETPLKKGALVKYLYGYYGSNINVPINDINKAVLAKYGKGILYTDRIALSNGSPSPDIPNYWIMEVEEANYPTYPPIDHLYASTEINGLANFDPRDYILEILEKDFGKKNIRFHQAYRFKPGRKDNAHVYSTWADHKGDVSTNDQYLKLLQQFQREEEEEENDMLSGT